ncbi:fimbria/pilus periplasmic chaperone [Bdellovibrionota bacterium FG-2]
MTRGIIFGFLAFFYLPIASAFTLSPMSVSFEPSGKGATQAFVIENDSAEKIPIQVSITQRLISEEGEETNPEPAELENLFVVFPSQMILEPKEKRTIRVSWKGSAQPATELAYRIIAEQLPVDTQKPKNEQKTGAMIHVLFRYVGSIYITPSGVKPDLKVSAEAFQVRKLLVRIQNKGGVHLVLSRMKLVLSSPAKEVVLKGDALQVFEGQNMLPGLTRRFVLPMPEGLGAAGLTAVLKTEE